MLLEREGAEAKDQGGFTKGFPGRGTTVDLRLQPWASALRGAEKPARSQALCLSSRHCRAAQKEPAVLTAPQACQLHNKEGGLTPGSPFQIFHLPLCFHWQTYIHYRQEITL